MQNLFRYVGISVCALSLVTVAGVALAQSNSSIDDVGGSIFDSVSIDLKVNGQDGPVTVAAGSRIVVSWISEGAARCRGNWSRNDIKSSGTVAGRISKSVVIKAACIDKESNRDDDSVVVNVEGKAQIAPQPVPVTQQPRIDYVQANVGERSVLYPGGEAVIYGTNLPKNAVVTVVIGDYKIEGWTDINGTQVGFKVPISIPPFQYKIYIAYDKGAATNAIGVSVISTTSAPPSISVFLPKGGETYVAGESVSVGWTSTGLQKNSPIRIDLANSEGRFVWKSLAYGIDNIGAATVQIPAEISSGKYSFAVSNVGGIATANSGTFTITTPTTSAQPTVTAPTQSTSGNVDAGNVGAGNVGAGNVGTGTATNAPSLSATAPTIAGARTPAGDKLYPGQMSITATISNSGGPLTNPVSARFQFSTNNVNWYDWVEVGPITATPRNVSYGWEGGTGSFYYRLCIGGGVDNCSAPTYIEIVYKEGAFFGVSRELAGVAVPATDVWAFLKAWLGR